VTLMGGSIDLKSLPREGTTITFTAHFILSPGLPPALAIDAHAAASEVTTPAAGILTLSISLRILLAEDNLVNQRVAMTMLGKMGHRITLATNGLEALEQWRKGISI
jgi:PleD family two-component response regulator